jgi:hypothetical protein
MCVVLTAWINRTRPTMPFTVPMILTEPKDHICDCYFSLTHVSGHISKTKHTIYYPNLSSVLRPGTHGKGLPVPKRPELGNLKCDEVTEWREQRSHKDDEYVPPDS